MQYLCVQWQTFNDKSYDKTTGNYEGILIASMIHSLQYMYIFHFLLAVHTCCFVLAVCMPCICIAESFHFLVNEIFCHFAFSFGFIIVILFFVVFFSFWHSCIEATETLTLKTYNFHFQFKIFALASTSCGQNNVTCTRLVHVQQKRTINRFAGTN